MGNFLGGRAKFDATEVSVLEHHTGISRELDNLMAFGDPDY